jgi:hypothetical protein
MHFEMVTELGAGLAHGGLMALGSGVGGISRAWGTCNLDAAFIIVQKHGYF